MAGLPLLMFIIFPAILALLVRYLSGLAGKDVAFFPVFLSLAIVSFLVSVTYVIYHYGMH